jgi:hypothetical protein
MEPWSAVRDPNACVRPSGSRVAGEVTDAEADCPAISEVPTALKSPGKSGADRQGKDALATLLHRLWVSGVEYQPLRAAA